VSTGGMSQAQWIAVISAVALVVSLFLAWGGLEGDLPDAPELPEGAPSVPGLEEAQEEAEDASEASGWESQNTLDIYLAIVAGLVLVNVLMAVTGNRGGLPFAPPAATFLLGAIGVILTAYVLIDVPEGFERKIGLYLATAAVIGVTVGSYLQLRDQVSEGY
jgi:hypothetical protein